LIRVHKYMANKKIAILFGMENTFPPALVDKINGMKSRASPPSS
jgi:hypothetical protein